MSSAYPAGFDSLPSSFTGPQPRVGHASHHDLIADAINKMQAELGLRTVASIAGSISSRLASLGEGINVVKDFGAVNNATGNQTQRFLDAIDAAPAKSVVTVPGGAYAVDPFVIQKQILLRGAGPERTVMFPRSGPTAVGRLVDFAPTVAAAGCGVTGLSFDCSNGTGMTALRVHNWSYDGYVFDCKFRGGTVGLDIGNCDAFTAERLSFINQNGAGSMAAHIGDVLFPNVTIKDAYIGVNGTNVLGAGVVLDSLAAGVTLDNIQIIAPVGTAAGIGTGFKFDYPTPPAGFGGHFLFISNCQTDGLTGPGMYARNIRQIQAVNSFFGTLPAAVYGGTSDGIQLDGGSDIMLANNWISGRGINWLGNIITNKMTIVGNRFPQTVPGGALFMPVANMPTNIDLGLNWYASQITNDAAKLDAATNYSFDWKGAAHE